MKAPFYDPIKRHYEECLRRHGPTWKGMDWPCEADVERRYRVMLDVMPREASLAFSLIDLGCGVGLMVDHLRQCGRLDSVEYRGIDISAEMIRQALRRHPEMHFECRDVLTHPLTERCVDYVVMNGLLTEKVGLSHGTMEEFSCRMIAAAFSACRKGIAFNVLSSHVDWCRLDLFHWPLDRAAEFLKRECSRNMVFRMDYGLYEYTAYVYRESTA